MNQLKLFQLKVIYEEHKVSPWHRSRALIWASRTQKPHLFPPHMDLLSGCQAICTLSHLGANTGKRVKCVDAMKFRDCTKGKYQSCGNQQKKKKIRQCWWGHTATKVCNEKKQPNGYYHLGNSLSISPVILDPHLLQCTPKRGEKITLWPRSSFLKALRDDFALCLLWLSQTKSYFL